MAVPEECDDGNYETEDGCNDDCTITEEWACEGEYGELSYCLPICGNGNVQTLDFGEECDDANTSSGDGCSSECILESPNLYICTGTEEG